MLYNRNLPAGDSLLWSDFDPVGLFTGSSLLLLVSFTICLLLVWVFTLDVFGRGGVFTLDVFEGLWGLRFGRGKLRRNTQACGKPTIYGF